MNIKFMFKYYVISSISITFSFLEMKKTNAVTNNFLRIVCINNKNKSLFPGLYYYTMKERFNLFLIFLTETISRTDEGQPRPKYIFNKCGTNIYFFTLQRFGPSPSPNLKQFFYIYFRGSKEVIEGISCAPHI